MLTTMTNTATSLYAITLLQDDPAGAVDAMFAQLADDVVRAGTPVVAAPRGIASVRVLEARRTLSDEEPEDEDDDDEDDDDEDEDDDDEDEDDWDDDDDDWDDDDEDDEEEDDDDDWDDDDEDEDDEDDD